MPNNNRIQKISEDILRELSRLISTLKDPRVKGLVSLTHVEVTKDLEFAKVYVSVLGEQSDAKPVLEGLTSASGFLRRELAASLSLRRTPRLDFIADTSLAHGARIHQLLSEMEKNDVP